MKAIMIMFDTLSRRFLSTYENTWIKTPNFERLRKTCTQFNQFYSGSLPCMPARRELHTGRYNFLHRSWGPLEPFDDSVFEILKKNQIYTHIVTDHNHYWEDGGATYLTRYSSWEGFRGQEGDCWNGIADTKRVPMKQSIATARKGKIVEINNSNRTRIQQEADYPSIQTMLAGIDFIKVNSENDNWLLQIECFDPHEPFQVPQRFLDLYEAIPDGECFDWPAYAPVCESEAEQKQLMIRYAALISMCDEFLGKVLDVMDERTMWGDTMLIVNTDHGFLMGEHSWWGKSVQPVYQEIAHLPFYLHLPKRERAMSQQLAQTIDIAPTILDFFHIEKPKIMQGQSLIPVIEKDEQVHDALLFGYFGGHVNVTDGHYIYMRAPINKCNSPLYEYTLMPTRMKGFIESSFLKQATLTDEFDWMKGLSVLKIPNKQFLNAYFYGNRLYDIQKDAKQQELLDDLEIEEMMIENLRRLLIENDAPKEQYERLGIHHSCPFTTIEVKRQRIERIREDTIQTSLSLTPKQVCQFQLIKSILPAPAYQDLLSRMELNGKNGEFMEEVLIKEVQQMMNQSDLSASNEQMFITFIKNADAIR